jgi:hypothetical protein
MLQHTLGKFGVHISMAPIVPAEISLFLKSCLLELQA